MVNAWSVAWSIGSAKRSDFTQGQHFIPGPGAYNVDRKQFFIPPKWRFGTENRGKNISNNNPGPGQYPTKTYVDNGSKYTIGCSTKQQNKGLQFFPGPGAYNIQKVLEKKPPQYSMRMKHSYSEKNFCPGPGAYNHQSFVFNQYKRSIAFSKEKRNELYQSTVSPGPGNYINIRPKTAAPQFKFGTGQRDGLYPNQFTPGPGQYQHKSTIDLNKGITMIARKNQQYQNYVPGPGEYDINVTSTKLKKPTFKIGTENRDGLVKDFMNTPGPGTYNPQIDASRALSIQYKVGTDIRKPLNSVQCNPGPGQYEFRPKTADGPKLTFKGVFSQDPIEKERKLVPGPGTYQPSEYFVKERPNTAKIGTGLRQSLYLLKDSPGPGNYNLAKGPKGPKWGFGSGLRDQSKFNEQPGPGAYDLPPVLADLPKFMMNNNISR